MTDELESGAGRAGRVAVVGAAVGFVFPAWAAAATAVLLGAASVGYPSQPSGFVVGWGTAAIAWGVALAAVSVRAPTRMDTRPDADRLAATTHPGGDR